MRNTIILCLITILFIGCQKEDNSLSNNQPTGRIRFYPNGNYYYLANIHTAGYSSIYFNHMESGKDYTLTAPVLCSDECIECAEFEVPPGTYNYTVSGGTDPKSASITVAAGQCYTIIAN